MRTVLSREGALSPTPPRRQTISVWWIGGEPVPPHGGLLDSCEKRRAHDIRDPHARLLFVVTHEAARVAIAHMGGAAPAEVRFDRTCPRCGRQHGKPRSAGLPGTHL